MFTLQQLETLVACVEHGSFSAAARKLGKAQSAISTAISNLEIDCNTLIFDRSSKVPVLTPQGKRLYSHALDLLGDAHQIESMMHSFSSGVEDSVTVAVNAMLLTPAFYQMVGDFYEKFPFTEFNLAVVENDVVPNMVSSGESNIGFMILGAVPPSNVNLGSIGHLKYSIAVHASHPLLSESAVAIEEVKRFRQIMLKDSPLHLNVPLSLSSSVVNNLDCVVQLLKVNGNWSLLPDHVIGYHSDLKRVHVLGEEKDWLFQVDRVTGFKSGKATQWLKDHSVLFT
ncbi:LysR family transcriptional regulator [Vibrio parahaemolyticus]|nr:LysR family transcriptional regulator [Vibrio parahaemolyticus]